MTRPSLQTAVLLLSLLCAACDHAFDTFRVRTHPSPASEAGTVFFDRWRTQGGVRIATSYDGHGCDVYALNGKKLARFPGGYCLFLPEENYFSVLDGPTLFDREFNIVWSRRDLHQHHDATYDSARDWIWLLTDNDTVQFDRKRGFLHDTVVALDRKTGKTVFEWKALSERAQLEAALGKKMTHAYSPILQAEVWSHMNSLNVIKPGQGGVALGGDIVLGETRHGLIFILRPATGKIIWSRVIGMGVEHHSGKYLDGGNILVFVNNVNSPEPKTSFWAMIDPLKPDFDWKQTTQNTYCDHFGYVERLPNGNHLVSHISDHIGAAFEITPKGRIVWEWHNGEKGSEGKPLEIYRVTYQPEEIVDPYISRWERRQGSRAQESGIEKNIESPHLSSAMHERKVKILTESLAAPNESAALKRIEEREAILMSVYREYPAPYPGAITNLSRCALNSRPHRETINSASSRAAAFELLANERLTYGECIPAEAKYNSIYFLLYCPGQNLVHDVKVFYPKADPAPSAKEWLKSLKCRGS